MGWLWNKIIAPVFKGVLNILAKPFQWSYANPVLGLALGVGAYALGRLLARGNRPWLAATFDWAGSLLVAAAIGGAVVSLSKRVYTGAIKPVLDIDRKIVSYLPDRGPPVYNEYVWLLKYLLGVQ